MRTLPRLSRAALLVTAAAALAACAGLPDRQPLPTARPVSAYATDRAFAGPAAAWPTEAWWADYRDPQLDRLIEEALAAAPSLAIAEARLRKAGATAQAADASAGPQLSANASPSEQKLSYNHLTPRSATPQGWNDYGRVTLDFSWELDFWGKNRAAIAAATSEAEAARADAAQARLVLAASLASAYAELARLHAAHDTAVAAFDVRAKTAELFARRQANGLETLASVRQVEARRASAEVDVRMLDEQLVLQRHRLAALMGAGPDRGLAIARPQVDLARGFGLPPQLAAELLGRRPDIAAARLRAEAAARRIDQTSASFYPNINLAAFIGLQSLGLDRLARSGSEIGSFGPALSLPIFEGGRLRANLRGSEADYAQAVASYDAAVVQALQEVADASASRRALAGQLAMSDEAVAASRDAWQGQQRRYEGGLATYLDVLSAEDSLLSNLRSQSDLRARSFALDVALKRALGGGYSNPIPQA